MVGPPSERSVQRRPVLLFPPARACVATMKTKRTRAMNSKHLKTPERWIPSAILFLLFVLHPLALAAADAPPPRPPATAATTNATTSTNTWLTFGLDRVEWLQISVMGNPLWQFLAALIYVVLAFYASKLLDYLIQVQLRRLTAKTKTQVDDLLLELVRGPVKIVAFVVLLHVGLQVFAWPDWAETFISNGLKITVAASLTYVALKFVDLVMGLWQKRVEAAGEAVLDMQLFPVIRKSLKVIVTIVAVLVTSQNLGMNVTGLLASLSIGGLAVGLRGSRHTLESLRRGCIIRRQTVSGWRPDSAGFH